MTPQRPPVGYRTNLVVDGPDSYNGTDFARVNGSLQLLLSLTIVPTGGFVFIRAI